MLAPIDPKLSEIAALAKVRPSHVYHCLAALAEAQTAFDPASFASFCQLEVQHITRIISALSDQGLLPAEKPAGRVRGTRLPEAFQIPPEWLEWAQAKRGWSQADARAEADLFVDYWQAKAGKDAVKLDWEKTWHVWVRNSRRADGIKSSYSSAVEPSGTWAEWAEKTAALYDKMGRTNEAAQLRARIGV